MTRHLLVALIVLVRLGSLATAQAGPPLVHAVESVMAKQLVTKVPPVYPPLARQAHLQGRVVLQVRISKSGDVGNLQLISGHPMLAPAAIEAVKLWKYMPYLLNGEPVEVETKVTVNFTLADKSVEGVVGDAPGGFPPSEQGGLAPGPAVPGRVRVSQGVSQALLLTKVPPQYPQEAKDQHIQGVVVMQVIVDKQGNVANIQLISGHPLLAPPAIDAVKQWKYKPYLLNETPVEVETQVQVNFTLVP